ncbi:MAG: glycosyltransferase family 2 protein [Phycisphaerales bacterium]
MAINLATAAAGGFLAAIWIVVLGRLARSASQVPSLRDGIEWADEEPITQRIVAIVPAHNEQDSIGGVLASLRSQRDLDVGVVLALDRCTDGTRDRAEQIMAGHPRFEVMSIEDCPDGWAGKVHCLWKAVTESRLAQRADLLLFLDADVEFAPDAIRAAAALQRRRDLALLTLLPTLRHRYWFENVVQPACVLELLYEFPPDRVNRAPGAKGGRRPFVNGQFILVRREDYERLGGHMALRDDIMEDFALARLVDRAGLAAGAFPAGDMLLVNMHETWASFASGWKRIFMAGAGRKVRRLRRWTLRVGLACALLPVAVGAGVAGAAMMDAPAWSRWSAIGVGAFGLVSWVVAIGALYRSQRAPWWSVALNPVGYAVAAWIMWRAARTVASREPVAWGGREYVFEPR